MKGEHGYIYVSEDDLLKLWNRLGVGWTNAGVGCRMTSTLGMLNTSVIWTCHEGGQNTLIVGPSGLREMRSA